jgi:hypothetical protein
MTPSALLVDVQADADDRPLAGRLRKDARDLATVHHHVVGPLDLDGEAERVFDGLCDRQAGDERELSGSPLRWGLDDDGT